MDQDCLELTQRVIHEVEGAGMKALRSFDLNLVRSGNAKFICPIHECSECTCQLVILLITPRSGNSLTVTLEGRDGQTWVYLETARVEPDEQVDPTFTNSFYKAIFSKNTIQSTAQVG